MWTTTTRWAKMAKKMRRIFGITKLKLQAFSMAALGDIVVKVTSMMERSSIQIAT